jgi:hypothetical protein
MVELAGIEVWFGEGLSDLRRSPEFRNVIEALRQIVEVSYDVRLLPVTYGTDENLPEYGFEIMRGVRRRRVRDADGWVREHVGGQLAASGELHDLDRAAATIETALRHVVLREAARLAEALSSGRAHLITDA